MNDMTSLGDSFQALMRAILLVLPRSPFIYLDMIPEVQQTLGIVNYFVPISTCITILEAWLSAIVGWYVSMVILRWVKAVS